MFTYVPLDVDYPRRVREAVTDVQKHERLRVTSTVALPQETSSRKSSKNMKKPLFIFMLKLCLIAGTPSKTHCFLGGFPAIKFMFLFTSVSSGVQCHH
jgi:hypothetical protein